MQGGSLRQPRDREMGPPNSSSTDCLSPFCPGATRILSHSQDPLAPLLPAKKRPLSSPEAHLLRRIGSSELLFKTMLPFKVKVARELTCAWRSPHLLLHQRAKGRQWLQRPHLVGLLIAREAWDGLKVECVCFQLLYFRQKGCLTAG